MRPKLVLIGGKADKAEIRLKLPTIVGRTHDAGLMIAHKTVSRRHCELFERLGMLFVRDTGSRNGTLVDNAPIKKEAMVKPGHTLTIGPLTFRADYEPADAFINSDESPDSNGAGAIASATIATKSAPNVPEEATRDIGGSEESSPATITQTTKPSDTPGELEFEDFSAADLAELDMPAVVDSEGDAGDFDADDLAVGDLDAELPAPALDPPSAPSAAKGIDEEISFDDDLEVEFDLNDLSDEPKAASSAADEDAGELMSLDAIDDSPVGTADDELAAFDMPATPPAAKKESAKADDGLLDDGDLAFDLDDLQDLGEPVSSGADGEADDLGFTLEDIEEIPAETTSTVDADMEEDDGLTFDLAGDADSAPEPEPPAPAAAAKKPVKDSAKVPLGEEKPAGGEADMSSFMKELGL
ncbi:MAG TPA: FHA domain-containing protein [Pirellulales bacterium]|jgi:predicted component of type VI protein secretion system